MSRSQPFEQCGRRVSLRQRDTLNSSASSLDNVSADDGVGRPVGALDENIGLNDSDDVMWRVFGEDHDRVHAAESRENFCTLVLRIDRPVRSLVQSSYGSVCVESHNEQVTECSRRRQVPHVTRVQQVEDAICEDDASALGLRSGSQCPGFRRRQGGR